MIEEVYFDFADSFETNYVTQGEYENRSIEETLDLGWKLLSVFPKEEMKRVRDEYIEKYFKKFKKEDDTSEKSEYKE